MAKINILSNILDKMSVVLSSIFDKMSMLGILAHELIKSVNLIAML